MVPGIDNKLASGLNLAADCLRRSTQYFDPFKFVVYTELIGKEHQAIPAEPVR